MPEKSYRSTKVRSLIRSITRGVVKVDFKKSKTGIKYLFFLNDKEHPAKIRRNKQSKWYINVFDDIRKDWRSFNPEDVVDIIVVEV